MTAWFFLLGVAVGFVLAAGAIIGVMLIVDEVETKTRKKVKAEMEAKEKAAKE